MKHAPTVIGLILTPSSRCAFVASSASLPWSTFLPQRVFTNVVRPIGQVISFCYCRESQISVSLPVPEAPQTIRQNWIPFLTFFFRRILICNIQGSVKRYAHTMLMWRFNRGMVLPRNAGLEAAKGAVSSSTKRITYCAQWRRHDCNLIDMNSERLRVFSWLRGQVRGGRWFVRNG